LFVQQFYSETNNPNTVDNLASGDRPNSGCYSYRMICGEADKNVYASYEVIEL